jgi:two-component system sensor histidine kinase DevS
MPRRPGARQVGRPSGVAAVTGTFPLSPRHAGAPGGHDQQSGGSLATTAERAVDNPCLHEQCECRMRWQQASMDVTRRLLRGADPRSLEMVLGCAVEGADGDFAGLARGQGEGLVLEGVVGAPSTEVAGRRMPWAPDVLAPALRTGAPVLVTDCGSPRSGEQGAAAGRLSLIAAPLPDDRGDAAVIVGRHGDGGASPFDRTDLAQLAAFTRQAGDDLEAARAHADRASPIVLLEHDRIVAELSDHVIGDLFATGMALLGVAQRLRQPELREQVMGLVDALDDTIRDLRSTVFGIRDRHGHDPGSREPTTS